MAFIYSHTFKVKPSELDEHQHVNNVVYVQWIQDVAEAHWKVMASKEMQEKYLWVVMRHEIDYKIPAVLNDEVTARTWVENYNGARSVRVVKLYRTHDDKLLAESKTTWCLLNSANRKPLRVGNDVTDLFQAQ